MRRIVAAMALLLLVGCGQTDWLFKTKQVEIPVPVPCNEPMPKKPDFAFDKMHVRDRFFSKGQAAAAELVQRQAYEKLLEDALIACRTLPSPKKAAQP